MTADETRLSALCAALGDPTRRALFSWIRAHPGATTGELAGRTAGMTRWAVMKHLETLRAAGLVQTLPRGRERRHYADPAALDPLAAWLDDARR